MPDLFVVMNDEELTEAVAFAKEQGAEVANIVENIQYSLFFDDVDAVNYCRDGNWFPHFSHYISFKTGDNDEIGMLLSSTVWNDFDIDKVYKTLSENGITAQLVKDKWFDPESVKSLNAKKAEMDRRKAIVGEMARAKIKSRIALYTALSSKYDVLRTEEIDDCDIKVERPAIKYEEIMAPPILYFNPVEEAFAECDAQVYSGLFENDIFEIEGTDNLDCFYLPVDNEHVLMTYSPTGYSFSSSIGFALKECVSKLSYFRTIFLGKTDLFVEFLGEYSFPVVSSFANRLISADRGKMEDVQPLLDDIVRLSRSKGKSMDNLNIYFPLVCRDGKWVYYTDAIDVEPPNILKLQYKPNEDGK